MSDNPPGGPQAPIDFEPPVTPSGQPQSVFGQWTAVPAPSPIVPQYFPPTQGASGPVPPGGAGGYVYPVPVRPPARRNRGAAAAIWVLIAAVVIAAAVKLVWSAPPASAPAPPTVVWTPAPSSGLTPYPTAVPTTPGAPATTVPVPPVPTGNFSGFCIAYFVFSIDVTTGWDSYANAVAQNQTTPALALAEQFSSDVQSVQGANPPVHLQSNVDAVTSDLTESVNVLRTGSVAGLPNPADVFSNIQALRAGADAYCNQ